MATIKEQRDLKKGADGGTQCTHKPNTEARSYKHCCCGKAVLHILIVSVCL